MLVRKVARPLLAAAFLSGGLDALLDPASKARVAERVAREVASIPGAPDDPVALVRLNAGVQLLAGTLLALGRLPRLAALALAASLGPTTVAGHPFWEREDPAERRQQRAHFAKNLSLLGGLLIAALDTEGEPGLAWRARHRLEHADEALERRVRASQRRRRRIERRLERRLARS